MLIWFICTALAALAAMVVVMPVLRPRLVDDTDHDLRIYHDQLDEITRDRDRGILTDDDAEARKAEIARRLIAGRRATGDGTAAGGGKLPALIAAGAVITGALGLYAFEGAPGYRDVPLQLRLAAAAERRETRPSQEDMIADLPARPAPEASDSYIAMVDELRRVMAANQDDLRGLALLVQHEANLGHYDAAITAQEHIIALKASEVTAADHLTLLDLLVYQAQGYVSPRSEDIARQILDEDPTSTGARHYIALLHDQTDRPDIAFDLWRNVIETGDAADPYVDLARRFVEQAAMRAGEDYALPTAPGPSDADIAAAQDMDPADRQAMIEGMVETLASRLASSGGPATEWARLIGALTVLGKTDRATAIWQEAQRGFAADPDGLALINDAANAAGLGQ